jgi:hypothetical protein
MDMIGTCHWRTPNPQPNGFLPLSAKDGLQKIVSMHIHRHFVPHHVRPPPVSLLSHIHTGANASCRACNPSIALSERYGTVPPPCYTSSKLKSARDTQKTPSQRQQRHSEVQPAPRLHRSLHVQDILLKLGLLEQFEQSTVRALHDSPGERHDSNSCETSAK